MAFYLFLVFLLIVHLTCATTSTANLSQQKLQIRHHLSRLNKTPVKSIKSPDGDIIDCVHLAHQPAFDHPLLQNHTIQMRPNFHPEGILRESKKSSKKPVRQLWQLNGKCPKGTIPVRRTKEEDIIRARSFEMFGKKKRSHVPPQPRSPQPDLISFKDHEHAAVYVEGEKYYGAKATINVWEPKIQQPNEFSLAQLWILGGTYGQDLNSIEVGWQVSPDQYGDSRTRLFIYWTSDAYRATGCYNLQCSGFVQINNEIAIGATIFTASSYGGSQYDITLLVWKDPKEGKWWLQLGEKTVLGYWPASLFSHLSDSASRVDWGGEVINSHSDGQHTTTQMGSGHFPGEGFGKAGYFKNIQVVDGSNNLQIPKNIGTLTRQPNCYNVMNGKDADWGSYFFFGGPGRNPNCP